MSTKRERKRCKFCGHWGIRVEPVRTMFGRDDGWRCYHPVACIKRQERLGQWLGKRILRRVDFNGTTWSIDPHPLKRHQGQAVVLTMIYRDIRLVSHHANVDAAKAHADEMERSCEATSLRQYTGGVK